MRTLNNEGRGKITKAVLVNSLKDRVLALVEEEHALAHAIYERAIPANIREAMVAVHDFHVEARDWRPFYNTSSLSFRYAGQRLSVGKSGEYPPSKPPTGHMTLEELIERALGAARFPNFHVVSSSGELMLTLDQGDEMGERAMKYWAERESLTEELNRQRAAIVAILATCKNEVQLKARWPEVMPLAEPFLSAAAPSTALTLPTGELNNLLKLPPEIEVVEQELEAA